MSDFFHVQPIKNARKTHRCEYCGSIIKVGDSYERETSFYDGDVCHANKCETCIAYGIDNEKELREYWDECLTYKDFDDYEEFAAEYAINKILER